MQESRISQYIDRLVNRFDCFNEQYVKDGRLSYALRKRAVTPELICKHLLGDVTLGLQALSTESTCKWVCWDSDHADGQLDALERRLKNLGLRCLRESKREGRDGHLWLFFSQPIPSKDAVYLGKFFGRFLKDVEFFPKQENAEVGSAMRAPLGYHRKPGAESFGYFEGCAVKEMEAQLDWFLAQPVNDSETWLNAIELWRGKEPKRRTRQKQYTRTAGSNILELIPAHLRKRKGREWIAQCPACAEAGMDTHEDNLRIRDDGAFCCVEGGIAVKHKARDIFRALQRQAQ